MLDHLEDCQVLSLITHNAVYNECNTKLVLLLSSGIVSEDNFKKREDRRSDRLRGS